EEKDGVYKIVDKDNQDFNYKDDTSSRWNFGKELHNSKGKKISGDVDTKGGLLDSVLINCEKLTCEGKKFRIYRETDENGESKYDYEDREIITET
ncbi:TPA: hypothetical protein ACPP32_001952, partial [Haemophilus influenzae]